MGAWTDYEAVRQVNGFPQREMRVQHTRENIARRMMNSPSCREVLIDNVLQTVCITHTAELDVKKIYSLPGEHLEHGGLVDFANNKWLITELDADNIAYEKGLMQQCNHILRWISKDGVLKEKWCYVVDGTKSGLADSPCLAYWKRYVITTPLIAGTPLEPIMGLGNQQPSLCQRGRFNDYPENGSTHERVEMGSPKPRLCCGMVKI